MTGAFILYAAAAMFLPRLAVASAIGTMLSAIPRLPLPPPRFFFRPPSLSSFVAVVTVIAAGLRLITILATFIVASGRARGRAVFVAPAHVVAWLVLETTCTSDVPPAVGTSEVKERGRCRVGGVHLRYTSRIVSYQQHYKDGVVHRKRYVRM